MGLSLKSIGKKLENILGTGVDAVIPGNQSYLHNGTPIQQQAQQAVHQVAQIPHAVSRAVAPVINPLADSANQVLFHNPILQAIPKRVETAPVFKAPDLPKSTFKYGPNKGKQIDAGSAQVGINVAGSFTGDSPGPGKLEKAGEGLIKKAAVKIKGTLSPGKDQPRPTVTAPKAQPVAPSPKVQPESAAGAGGETLGQEVRNVVKAKGQTKPATVTMSKPVQATELPRTAAPVIPQVPQESSLAQFNPRQYVKQQVALQDAATKIPGSTKLKVAQAGFKQKAIDALAPIETPVNKATGGFYSPESLALRNQLDRSLRSNTLAGQYIKDKGLHNIIQNVPNTDEFNQYLIAKHGADLHANGVSTGRNLAKDQQLVEALAPKYEAHAQALTQYNHHLLDTATNYGLISKETANYLKQKYPNYVPFDRVFTDAELQGARGNGRGPASLSTQTVVQRIKGSSRQVAPPLESIVSKSESIIGQGERNLAAKQVASTISLPGNPLGIRELKPNETIGTRPTISFFENGKQRVFETTPEVAAAAKSLNKEQLGLVGKILSIPTRVLRLGATGANVSFALANVAKDSASAFINSSHPLRSSVANPKVFLQALAAATHHGGKSYEELVREGAGGTSFDIARSDIKHSVKQIRAGRNAGSQVLYTVTHPGQLLRAVENTIGRSEEFGRAMQYYGNKGAALAKGATEGEAKVYGADAARNNTVNFARAGEYGRVLNSVLPYLNAGIQGSRTLVRNLKERPAQTTAKIVITAFLPVATTTAWNLGSPERKKAYDNISEYEKQNNIIIVPPHPKQDDSGRWNVIKIPISQEVANLGNIVRNGVESMAGDKNFDFAQMAGNLFGSATSLNTQSGRQTVNQLIPQALKPGVEALTNQNLFTGQSIVPDALKNLAPQDQTNKGTSGTAKVIGKLTGSSPLQIDSAIKTATGGLGQNIVHLSDQALAKVGAIGSSDVKGKSLGESIANRFDSAQGQTPGALYFSTLQKTAKDQHLAGSDFDQLNSIVSKSLTPDGQPRPLNEQDSLEKHRILAASPNIAKVIADSAKALAQKTGKEVDPLYNLSPEQQHDYYQIQATPYKSDDYVRLTDKAQGWLPAFQDERSAYYDRNPLPVGGSASDKVQYPKFDDITSSLLDQAGNLSGAERAKFIQDNPALQSAYDQIFKYTNDKRVAQGYDPYKAYPSPNASLQAAINSYNQLAKGTGARKAWIQAHPDTYAQMQNYYAQSASWELANNAGKAKYEGTDLNQQALKAAYSLGQYDIAKNADGSYSLNPQAASAANSSGSFKKGGGSRRFSKKPRRISGRIKKTRVKVGIKKGSGQISMKTAKSGFSKPKVSIRKSLV